MSTIVECVIYSQTDLIRSGQILVHEKENGTRKRVWERSLQDLIAICLPYMIILTDSAIAACFFYDPTMKFLLYSGLPGGYQNVITFWVCMMEEICTILMCTGTLVPLWQVQVIAFELVNNVLKQVGNFLNR